MSDHPLEPFEKALLHYWHGNHSAILAQQFRNGHKQAIPVSVFFRAPEDFAQSEDAIQYCRGRVLCVGAGSGVHALELQRLGFKTTAIDICRGAVDIMKAREVQDARHMDFYEFGGELFDTVLLLGQNIGMAGTLSGLQLLLEQCQSLLKPDGQVLLNSVDETSRSSPTWGADGYPGELEFRLCYEGDCGPWLQWLHIDCDTLAKQGLRFGWSTERLTSPEQPAFLARMTLVKG